MNTALQSQSPSIPAGRVRVLGAASALIAGASVAVTLAMSGGGEAAPARPSGEPETAQPNRATLYHRGAGNAEPAASVRGIGAAERFHHFR